MVRCLRLCLLSFLPFLGAALNAQTEMAWSDVRDRYVESTGGWNRLRAMKALSIRATIIDAEERRCSLQIWKARPDRSRTLIQLPDGLRVTQGYDGSTAWQRVERSGREVVEEMNSHSARHYIRNAYIESPLVRPELSGATVVYRGLRATEAGEPAHRVEVNYPNGDNIIYHLDPETYAERRYITSITIDGQTLRTETELSDYRRVEGILFAFRMLERNEAGEETLIEVESVKINPGIMNALFEMPSVATAGS